MRIGCRSNRLSNRTCNPGFMRLHRLSSAVTVAFVAALGACSQLIAPSGGIEFVVGKAEPSGPGDSASASAAEGTITIEGRMTTPDPCQDIRAEVTVGTGEVGITVIARSKDVACPQMIAAFPYRVLRGRLENRDYRVRVVHRYENTGWAEKIVLDATVTVR